MRRHARSMVALACTALLMGGCTADESFGDAARGLTVDVLRETAVRLAAVVADEADSGEVAAGPSTGDDLPRTGEAGGPSAPPVPPAPPEPVDPAEVGANELGEIPVIMYHRVTDDGSPIYDTTLDEFRAEIAYLHEAGYHPVRVVDLVDGRIEVPAGKSPVVLTFDDSSQSQFSLDEDGVVEPDSAIGILLAFAADNPGFVPTGSFYVLDDAFGVSGQRAVDKLRYLDRLGFEIGNHTLEHGNLRSLGAEGARRDLALGAQMIRDALPGNEVRTLALPYGVWPDDPEVARSGTWEGIGYEHDGILLVGANPAPSPFDVEFDPLAIPRIRAQPVFDPDEDAPDLGSGYWLWVLEDQHGRRYVSDGDPDTISFPAELSDRLRPEFADRANPY